MDDHKPFRPIAIDRATFLKHVATEVYLRLMPPWSETDDFSYAAASAHAIRAADALLEELLAEEIVAADTMRRHV